MEADTGRLSRIDRMGEAALLLTMGQGIAAATNERVLSVFHALRDAPLEGVTDLVPAYSSLLVQFDPDVLEEQALRLALERAASSPREHRAAGAGRRHVIPVRYGGDAGPDLEELAASHDLSPEEAVRLHTGRDYRVYFTGFLPGFSYMGRLTRSLATPRFSDPRTRVPAGSVGIADVQTGIYPFASPGGWRIVGRTDFPCWDLSQDPPVTLQAGDTVTFVVSHSDLTPAGPSATWRAPADPVIEVTEPGAMTTVQDLGWLGQGHLGLGAGGASDPAAVVMANALVGNDPGAAVLEMTLTGGVLTAVRSFLFALEGADFGCRVDNEPVSPGIAWFARAGSVLRFAKTPASTGLRAYLAVSGGIDVPPVLGSRSTALRAGFGGCQGRPLRAGDLLGRGAGAAGQYIAGRFWLGRVEDVARSPMRLRFVRHDGAGSAGPRAVEALTGGEWVVGHQSDRMGTRLVRPDGPGIPTRGRELVSFGVVRGAIQVPHDGYPIVLNADYQTTGGYPLAGVLARVDWPQSSQLRTGDRVRFEKISVEEARRAYTDSLKAIERGLTALQSEV